jgi:hypothetical protein
MECWTCPEELKVTKTESRGGATNQHPRGVLTPSRGQERHKGWQWGWGDKPTSQRRIGGGSTSWSHETEGSIQNWTAPPCWGRRKTNRVVAVGQLSCRLVKKTRALTILHELAELLQLPTATCPVDRRNQILLKASLLVRPHQSSCLYANTRIRHLRNNSRTFTKQTELFVVPWCFFFLYY